MSHTPDWSHFEELFQIFRCVQQKRTCIRGSVRQSVRRYITIGYTSSKAAVLAAAAMELLTQTLFTMFWEPLLNSLDLFISLSVRLFLHILICLPPEAKSMHAEIQLRHIVHTVEPNSNGPASNRILLLRNTNFWSLQPFPFYFLHWLQKNSTYDR